MNINYVLYLAMFEIKNQNFWPASVGVTTRDLTQSPQEGPHPHIIIMYSQTYFKDTSYRWP